MTSITKKLAICIALVVAACAGVRAQGTDESKVAQELTGLLRQFLDDAAQGNRAGFERFFADDVIYTRSVGVVMGKPELLKNVENLKPSEESKTTYGAENRWQVVAWQSTKIPDTTPAK